jgi:hypothetical protein
LLQMGTEGRGWQRNGALLHCCCCCCSRELLLLLLLLLLPLQVSTAIAADECLAGQALKPLPLPSPPCCPSLPHTWRSSSRLCCRQTFCM